MHKLSCSCKLLLPTWKSSDKRATQKSLEESVPNTVSGLKDPLSADDPIKGKAAQASL